MSNLNKKNLAVKEEIENALLTYDGEEVTNTARRLLDEGINVLDVIEGFTKVLEGIGKQYEEGEIFIMHLIAAGEAATRALKEVIEPELAKKGEERKVLGKIVIGTVQGDIHDIGKNIVSSFLFSSGFEVFDLGSDVSTEEFLNKVNEVKADVLGMSALLTTTLPFQKAVIERLESEGMRKEVKVIVGGAPTTRKWADEIGADGYAEDALNAVKVIKKLLNVE